jgi:predicted nucleotidyltransferase
METLRSLVEDHLPLDVPTSYVGMAKNNYRKYLNPERDSYEPTAKKFLYVLRGMLAAQYVQETRSIEADVTVLTEAVRGETGLVEDLVAVKREEDTGHVPDELAARADEQITALFDESDPPERVEKSAFRDAIDDWMLSIRQ